MEQKEIEIGNFLIAKFIGFVYPDIDNEVFKVNLHDLHNYHEDWRGIMGAVQKIRTITERMALVQNSTTTILRANTGKGRDFEFIKQAVGVEIVWEAVVSFIKFYNTNSNSKS